MTTSSHAYHLWIKVLLFTGALMALVLFIPASPTGKVSAQSGERTLSLSKPAATRVQATRLKSPPVVSAKEKARLQAQQAQLHRRGPATRVNTSGSARATSARIPATTPRAAATINKPRVGSSVNAPETFTLFQNTDLQAVVTGTTSVVDEPSVGNIGSAVFETGNWFASLSTDGGSTFGYIDPATTFPSAYGGFCCDQSVVYDPSRDLMLWSMLYAPNSSGNIIRLAIAHGEAALEATPISLYYYDFAPQDLGWFPADDWYDYPQIALGSNYLYITTNVFQSDMLTFDGTMVLRLPLDGLASGLAFGYTGFFTGYFNLTPVHGATNTMYFATQNDSATLRVYQWPEGGSVSASNVSHTYYPDPSIWANYTCPLTGGIQDWCGRLDDRVLTGWVSGGILGFMWNAPKGTGGFGTFAYPYIQVLFVNAGTMTSAGQSLLYSETYAYAYPGAGVNAAGHVAGTLFRGGGDVKPTVAAFIWDNYSPTPYPQIPTTWELYVLAASTQGPIEPRCPNCWGDYLVARRDYTSRYTRYLWVATGFTLQGGGYEENIHPYFFRFGREWNDPVAVEDRDKTHYLPLIQKSE